MFVNKCYGNKDINGGRKGENLVLDSIIVTIIMVTEIIIIIAFLEWLSSV